jgi:hypothetical protein
MGVPVAPPAQVTTITTTDQDTDYDEDTISILPSQSYDNIIIDLSKASFHEIESRLDGRSNSMDLRYATGTGTDGGTTSSILNGGDTTKTDAANIFDIEEEDGTTTEIKTQLSLDEKDLNPLLEILLRGKNDDIDEETMNQSMSIYRKLLKPTYGSAAAIAGDSVGGITTTTAGIVIHEGTLVYAVRKKYSDVYMMELMHLLIDAIEESHNHKTGLPAVDGRRILDLALIYGNVGASRVIVERYPESLKTRDFLRGQLPLHM